MRRILLVVMSTVAGVVMAFGYRTSTPHPASPGTTAVATDGAGNSAGSGTSTAPAAPQSDAPPDGSTPSSPSATGTRTVTGELAQTRWGPVQVQITLSGDKVTSVQVVQVPAGNPRDVEINDYAVPVLKQETLQAQSAQIDSVSGATVTSEGYIASLQSALDQAGR